MKLNKDAEVSKNVDKFSTKTQVDYVCYEGVRISQERNGRSFLYTAT